MFRHLVKGFRKDLRVFQKKYPTVCSYPRNISQHLKNVRDGRFGHDIPPIQDRRNLFIMSGIGSLYGAYYGAKYGSWSMKEDTMFGMWVGFLGGFVVWGIYPHPYVSTGALVSGLVVNNINKLVSRKI